MKTGAIPNRASRKAKVNREDKSGKKREKPCGEIEAVSSLGRHASREKKGGGGELYLTETDGKAHRPAKTDTPGERRGGRDRGR